MFVEWSSSERYWQFLSCLKVFLHFIKFRDSLPHSQDPVLNHMNTQFMTSPSSSNNSSSNDYDDVFKYFAGWKR
jgi:hypothetical protein